MWSRGGWSDEDEDDPGCGGPSISSPSATAHVSGVRCMGALSKAGRFSFSARTTYICSLVGDNLRYARGKAGKLQQLQHLQQPRQDGRTGVKIVSLSKLRRVRFQYDHTVEERSLQRNRITFEYGIASDTSLSNGTLASKCTMSMTPATSAASAASMGMKEGVATTATSSNAAEVGRNEGTTDLTFSAPSDKDMFRWEACLRSVPCLHTRCRSVLKDHLGRLRPYQHGMGQVARGAVVASLRREGKASSVGSAASASATYTKCLADERKERPDVVAVMFETVRVIEVQLPDELGVMHISLNTSSLTATIAETKAAVFANIRQMRETLWGESGLDRKGGGGEEGGEQNQLAATERIGPKISFREPPKLPHQERANKSRVPVHVTKQQFINPLAFATSPHVPKTPSSTLFQSPRAGSTLSDADHLPNQVLNPFAAMQQQQDKEQEEYVASVTGEGSMDPGLRPPGTPSQALARHELESVEDILRRGAKAFLLYRPYRTLDADIGAEFWAFEEHKSVESLSTGGTGVLKLELRAASDMPHSGLRCIVRKTKAKDIFGKVTDHYHVRVLATDLSWDVKYKFAPIKKFALSLHTAYTELPLEQRRLMVSQHFGHGQPGGHKKGGPVSEHPLPLPALSNLFDSVESVQLYLDLVLAHPWASSGHHLLEFLGAATAARDRTERMIVHISQLREYVSPGDIVLFKCSDRWSGLTRLMLRDRFDHIGVIVPGKNPGSNLRILESTGEGVKTYPLIGRLRGYFLADFVHFISVRRIVAPREEKALARCAKFVSAVEGKPYRLRQAVVGRMRGRHVKGKGLGGNDPTMGASEEDPISADETSKKKKKSTRRRKSMDGSQAGYFCSEITAAYLKHLGFIGDRDADCAGYWPGDFDEGGVVEQDVVRMGFRMEKIVDLDLRIVELAKAERREGARGQWKT
jgi:hypothetical protein